MAEDIDIVIVRRLLDGHATASNRPERAAATHILTARGKSDAWIAKQLRVCERSVTRYRADNRAARWASAMQAAGI